LGEPERLQGQIVSSNFFQTLGIRPFRGRDFVAEDDRPGALPVAILSSLPTPKENVSAFCST